MLQTLLPLLVAPATVPDIAYEYHFHRSVVATAGVPLEAPRIGFAAAEMTGDGITDLVVLPQASGQEYAPRFLEAAYSRESVGFLPGVAEDVASAPGLPGIEATDPVFTVSADVLWRHTLNSEGLLVADPHVEPAWQGGDLRCVAAANETGASRYVVVAEGTNPTTIHVLTDDGAGLQPAFPAFPVPGTLRDIALLDYEVLGGGAPSHVAVRTTTSVELRELDGTFELSLAGAFAHWAVLPGEEPAPDALALVSGAPGQSVVTTMHPIHGVTASPLPGWTLVGVDAGDVNGDGLADLAYATINPMRWGVLPHEGWTAPFVAATAKDVYNASGSLLAAPHLFNHDNDDDLDLLILSEDLLHVYLGGIPDDEEPHKMEVNGVLSQGDETTYTFTIQPPSSLPQSSDLSVAYRLHYQSPFNPQMPAAFVMGDELENVTQWPVEFEVTLTDPPRPSDAFFLEFFVIDNDVDPRRAYPVTDYAWSAPPNARHDPGDPGTWDPGHNQSQLGAICAHINMGECLPKNSIGIMRIPFIPPPVPPITWE